MRGRRDMVPAGACPGRRCLFGSAAQASAQPRPRMPLAATGPTQTRLKPFRAWLPGGQHSKLMGRSSRARPRAPAHAPLLGMPGCDTGCYRPGASCASAADGIQSRVRGRAGWPALGGQQTASHQRPPVRASPRLRRRRLQRERPRARARTGRPADGEARGRRALLRGARHDRVHQRHRRARRLPQAPPRAPPLRLTSDAGAGHGESCAARPGMVQEQHAWRHTRLSALSGRRQGAGPRRRAAEQDARAMQGHMQRSRKAAR